MSNAFASIVQARPCPTFGRPVHRRGGPHRLRPGTSPHALRIPLRSGHPALQILLSSGFRFTLAVSGFRFRARVGFSIPSPFSGPRGITPAFGYSAPHSSAGGTLTLMSYKLLSTHYRGFRLLPVVHTQLRGLPSSWAGLPGGSQRGGLWLSFRKGFSCIRWLAFQSLPVHSPACWALRLRRIPPGLATYRPDGFRLPFQATRSASQISFSELYHPAHRSLGLRFADYLTMPHAKLEARMVSLFLSCRALSSPTVCRFIPALCPALSILY